MKCFSQGSRSRFSIGGAKEECENFFVKLFFVKFIFILANKWGGLKPCFNKLSISIIFGNDSFEGSFLIVVE